MVHRDVKPENVMIFDADFHKIKLIDFGMTRKCGSYVRRLIGSIPYSPPEVCDAVNNDILVSTAMDVWAFGVLLFCSLTGKREKKRLEFVSLKHDLKGVLKYLGVRMWTPFLTDRDRHR
jgi:serine/threonine protein kinase